MAFWWVNHKRTYSAEVGGGYIWSPKTNQNGSKNQTYINLTLTRPGDVVISYAGRLIKAIGLLLSPHIDKLFDRGWITFTDAGDLLCAKSCIERALQQWGIQLPINVGPFKPKQSEYLAYHRSEIYRSDPSAQ